MLLQTPILTMAGIEDIPAKSNSLYSLLLFLAACLFATGKAWIDSKRATAQERQKEE